MADLQIYILGKRIARIGENMKEYMRSISPSRLSPQQEATDGAFFICGGIGCIINIVASALYCFTTLTLLSHLYLASYAMIDLVTYILLGVGIILASTGYLGMRRYYGSGLGLASFILGVITAVCFSVYSPNEIILEQLNISYNSNMYHALQLGWIFILNIFYDTLILWGITHILNRSPTGKSGLSTATGILCILTAGVMASSDTLLSFWFGPNVNNSFYNFAVNYTANYVLDSIWSLLLVTAEILAVTLFFTTRNARFGHGESQHIVQTPQ